MGNKQTLLAAPVAPKTKIISSVNLAVKADYVTTIDITMMFIIVIIYLIALGIHLFLTRKPEWDDNTSVYDDVLFGLVTSGMIIYIFMWPIVGYFGGTWSKIVENKKVLFVGIMYLLTSIVALSSTITLGIGVYNSVEGSEDEFSLKITSMILNIVTIILIGISCGVGIADKENFC